MIVAGIDLSLTSTGVCVIDTATGQGEVWRIQTKGFKGAPTVDYVRRINHIYERVSEVTQDASRVAIEGPDYGASRVSSTAAHQLAGLWWCTVSEVEVDLVIPPSVVKKYATGKGNAGKDEVLASAVRRYPNIEIAGNDTADATILAAICARLCGHPIDDVPKLHLSALDKMTSLAADSADFPDGVIHDLSERTA